MSFTSCWFNLQNLLSRDMRRIEISLVSMCETLRLLTCHITVIHDLLIVVLVTQGSYIFCTNYFPSEVSRAWGKKVAHFLKVIDCLYDLNIEDSLISEVICYVLSVSDRVCKRHEFCNSLYKYHVEKVLIIGPEEDSGHITNDNISPPPCVNGHHDNDGVCMHCWWGGFREDFSPLFAHVGTVVALETVLSLIFDCHDEFEATSSLLLGGIA